jgi:phosphoglycerate dehydrogenase-like enzyme
LLLLGAGAIAGHIGRVAQALGLRVAVVRASARASATRADAPRAPRVDVCCGFDEAEFPPEPPAAAGTGSPHDPARLHAHVHRHSSHVAPDAGAGALPTQPHVEAAALLPDWADEVHPPGVLGALLPVTDWLVIACPLTEDTRGWIDAAAIARLPRRACVINVGRGEIVDQAALTDALAAGRLAGAYLDVFDPEPLPADSALWGLPNVILSPHDSASAAGNDRRVFERFCDNLDRLQAGRALVNEARP